MLLSNQHNIIYFTHKRLQVFDTSFHLIFSLKLDILMTHSNFLKIAFIQNDFLYILYHEKLIRISLKTGEKLPLIIVQDNIFTLNHYYDMTISEKRGIFISYGDPKTSVIYYLDKFRFVPSKLHANSFLECFGDDLFFGVFDGSKTTIKKVKIDDKGNIKSGSEEVIYEIPDKISSSHPLQDGNLLLAGYNAKSHSKKLYYFDTVNLTVKVQKLSCCVLNYFGLQGHVINNEYHTQTLGKKNIWSCNSSNVVTPKTLLLQNALDSAYTANFAEICIGNCLDKMRYTNFQE